MKFFLVFSFVFSLHLVICTENKIITNNVIENINDIKQFKNLLRTKNNLLILFISNKSETRTIVKNFNEAAIEIKGIGTMVLIDCSKSENKKLCKKLKIPTAPYIIKHYKDGNFHKDYDRQLVASSIANFMRDPTGDLPWNEDPTGLDVVHIADSNAFNKLINKDTRPIMVMFYAPWCGYCKQLKPEYSAAATELKPKYLMSAVDVDKPENAILRRQYNITGFPTLLYFENTKVKYVYDGENKKDALIAYMKDPKAAPITKTKEIDWSAETSSEIVHLTTNGFDPAIKDEKSVLVMFYAPWCGHCKRMKPEYEKAAEIMKNEKIPGILAALDATKETSIAQMFKVKGYPTVKYFVNGEYKFDVNVREAEKIISFMKDPKEPPPPPPPETPWEEEESEVIHLNDENFKTFLKRKKHALVMFYAPWCGHCKKTKPQFTNAANHFKDEPRIALAAIDCTRYQAICSIYEVRGYPTFKYFNYYKTHTDYNGGRTELDFIKFLENPDQNNNDNENVPKAFGTYEGIEHVRILNDKNFEQVLQANKKVFVLFYTSWCGHCKAAKPEFARAAQNIFTSKKDIIFAAVDCDFSRKTAEKYNIQGYPTLILFENGKETQNYNGARKSIDFINFVTKTNRDEL